MVITVTIAKADDDRFTYTYSVEGMPDSFVQGPFKLGEQFEFFDTFEKRTEEVFR